MESMIRKITREAQAALLAGKYYKKANTAVLGDALYLHGNEIARISDGVLSITLAGWPSVTTRERLNGLPGVSLSQKKGVQYLNGTAINSRDWYTIGAI